MTGVAGGPIDPSLSAGAPAGLHDANNGVVVGWGVKNSSGSSMSRGYRLDVLVDVLINVLKEWVK